MTGCRKGVFAFIKERQPSAYLSGCPCHLLHHAAEKAASCLPFSIEQALVDTYYYLDKSSKRRAGLEKYQKLYYVDHVKIHEHVPTRWLSVCSCLSRMLENWDALKMFFVDEKAALVPSKKPNPSKSKAPGKSDVKKADAKPTDNSYKVVKVMALEQFYRSPNNHLYCLFLQSAIVPFEKLITALQTEQPQIHSLRRSLHKLMRDILVKFIVPSAIYGKVVTEVRFEEDKLLKKDDHILIGDPAREFLQKKEENHLKEARITEFFQAVKQFYRAACTYLKTKLPFHDDLLRFAEVADPDLRMHHTQTDPEFWLDRFPCLIPEGSSRSTVLMEFADIQAQVLPKAVTADTESEGVDKFWLEVGKLKDTIGELMYSNVSHVMLSIVCITHSNASCERIFSCVRKNKTDQRASMKIVTLDALMVLKAQSGDLTKRKYSVDQCKQVKSAYYKSLKH